MAITYYPARKIGQVWRVQRKPGKTGQSFDITLGKRLSNGWEIKSFGLFFSVAYDQWWKNPEDKSFIMILLCAKAHD